MTEYCANELRRLIGMIPLVDPTTMEYHMILQSLECFAGIVDSIEEIIEQVGEPNAEEGSIIKVEFRPQPAAPVPVVDVAPEDTKPDFPPEPESPFPPEVIVEKKEDKTEESQAQGEPARVWQMAEVRAALVEARRSKGLNITELLKEYGVENFSAFPAGKYDELMKRLEE